MNNKTIRRFAARIFSLLQTPGKTFYPQQSWEMAVARYMLKKGMIIPESSGGYQFAG